MSSTARIGTALAGVAWLVLGAVLVSFARSPDAADACKPNALWTGDWFFVAPLLALLGLAFMSRRSSRRLTGLAASALLGIWALVAFLLWLLAAVGHGVSCGGG